MPELHERAIESFRRAIDLAPRPGPGLEGARLVADLARPRGGRDRGRPARAGPRPRRRRRPRRPRPRLLHRPRRLRSRRRRIRDGAAPQPAGGLVRPPARALLRRSGATSPAGRRRRARPPRCRRRCSPGGTAWSSSGRYMRLGHLAALQGRHQEALDHLERELRFLQQMDHALRNRTTIELHQRIGSAYLNLGRTRGGPRGLPGRPRPVRGAAPAGRRRSLHALLRRRHPRPPRRARAGPEQPRAAPSACGAASRWPAPASSRSSRPSTDDPRFQELVGRTKKAIDCGQQRGNYAAALGPEPTAERGGAAQRRRSREGGFRGGREHPSRYRVSAPPLTKMNQRSFNGGSGMASKAPEVTERESLKVAEASRQAEWTQPSFMRELFLGNFRLDLIHPYPAAGRRPARVHGLLRRDEALPPRRRGLRSEIDATGEYPRARAREPAPDGRLRHEDPEGVRRPRLHERRVPEGHAAPGLAWTATSWPCSPRTSRSACPSP